jgi:hypothetical protein
MDARRVHGGLRARGGASSGSCSREIPARRVASLNLSSDEVLAEILPWTPRLGDALGG